MTQLQENDRDLAFWKQQLAGANLVLELPTDHPRPPVQNTRRAQVPVELPNRLREALTELSWHDDASLVMALLAAFQVLLYR